MFTDREMALRSCPLMPKSEPAPPSRPYHQFSLDDVSMLSRESFTKLETLRVKMQTDLNYMQLQKEEFYSKNEMKSEGNRIPQKKKRKYKSFFERLGGEFSDMPA